LGGNCRLRVPNNVVLVNGKALKQAKGENPNLFFATVKVKDPLISEKASLNEVNLKPTLLYDLPTEAGKTYTIICKK
jgi:alpha-L-fucosidase 2